jgi:hypothetical protein
MHVKIPALLAAVVLLLFFDVSPVASQDRPAALPRVAIEDDGNGSSLAVLETLKVVEPRSRFTGVSLAARLVLTGPVLDSAIDARIAAIEQYRAPLWLALPVPSTDADVEPWRVALRRLIDRRDSTLAILELVIDRQPARLAVFATQLAATEARARVPGVRVALGGDAMMDEARRREIYSKEVAPYVELLALQDGRAEGAAEWLDQIDRDARLVLTSASSPPPGQDAARVVVESVVKELGTAVASHAWRSSDVTPAALRALASLSSVAGHEISVLDPAAVGLALTVGAQDVTASLQHRVLFDTETFSTLLVYWGTPSTETLAISLRVPIEGTPGVVDLLTGERSLAAGYRREPRSEQTHATAPLTGRPMLVNFNEGATAIAEGTKVSAERQLTVGEIISRHQQQQLAQDRLVRHYMADARMRQFFKPTLTDPGYDVVTENRYFVDGEGIEWEEKSFAVNNRKWGADRPPLPLLQPEEVFSLPLQLRFDEGYTYELAGTDRVDGFDCYEVRFKPMRRDASLYHGTVWIDRRTFARIRVHAVQGDLSGTVVSNEETHRYAPVATIGNQPVFLFNSLTGRQIMLVAGRNILVEKSVTFSGFRVNDESFEEARASARASDRIMFRETPAGLRYYVKRDGIRVISDRPTESVKAMAIGTVIDPSYAFPLPIFGINYVDFSFGNPDTQLAMLFAGVLAAGNIQRPQLGSTPLDASLDFFAIAAPSSDRLYDPAGEREAERVLTWPMTTGVNLGWQATAFQKVVFQYQFRFDAYVRDTTTSESFQVPSSTITNGVGGAWEYSRSGYTVALNGAWFTRANWKPWGLDGSEEGLQETPRRYAKFAASVTREFFIDAFQKFSVNGAWFGGRDLDRFVKYQFGMFDATRVHGVPAGLRFGELSIARGSYSVNIFDQYRLDLFLDHAWARDEGEAERQRIPGVGAAFNLPGPWNTIVRADVGKSWLPARYGDLGSTTLQIMLLKPLR